MSGTGDHCHGISVLRFIVTPTGRPVNLHLPENGSDSLLQQDFGEGGRPKQVLLVDAIPLTLEEIFIYELGGEDYEVRDIVL